MTALDLHSVAIIAQWWIEEKIAKGEIIPKSFEKELEAAKQIRKIASRMNDEDEIFIDEQPF